MMEEFPITICWGRPGTTTHPSFDPHLLLQISSDFTLRCQLCLFAWRCQQPPHQWEIAAE